MGSSSTSSSSSSSTTKSKAPKNLKGRNKRYSLAIASSLSGSQYTLAPIDPDASTKMYLQPSKETRKLLWTMESSPPKNVIIRDEEEISDEEDVLIDHKREETAHSEAFYSHERHETRRSFALYVTSKKNKPSEEELSSYEQQ